MLCPERVDKAKVEDKTKIGKQCGEEENSTKQQQRKIKLLGADPPIANDSESPCSKRRRNEESPEEALSAQPKNCRNKYYNA